MPRRPATPSAEATAGKPASGVRRRRDVRLDAVRNRARILEAARSLVADLGPDVSMVKIATAAQVAVGTLYNHFPTKVDLLAAVLEEYVHQVADSAEQARHCVEHEGAEPDAAIIYFLRFAMDASAVNHAVKSAVETMGSHAVGNPADEMRAVAALDYLIAEGQRQGRIRPGIAVDDIYLLVHTAPTASAKVVRDRWLDLVSRGLCCGRRDRR